MSFGTKISEIEQEIAENKSAALITSLNKLLDIQGKSINTHFGYFESELCKCATSVFKMALLLLLLSVAAALRPPSPPLRRLTIARESLGGALFNQVFGGIGEAVKRVQNAATTSRVNFLNI